MSALRRIAAFGLAFIGAASNAVAGDAPMPSSISTPTFYVHAGAAGLLYKESAQMSVLGSGLPGATVAIKDVATFAIEAGYYLTPEIAVSATAGFPPLSKVTAAGSIEGLGTLGKSQGGPAGLTVHYHVPGLGAFQPYFGGGVAALIGFNDKDALMQGLKVKNTFGPMLQVGFDLMLDERWGLFVDVKKSFLETVATGTLGGAPVKAKVTLDPLVVHSGIAYRW